MFLPPIPIFLNYLCIRFHTGHFLTPHVTLVQPLSTTYQQDILVNVARPPSTLTYDCIKLTWDLSKWSLSCSSVLALLVPNTLGIFLMEVILELACYFPVLQAVPHPFPLLLLRLLQSRHPPIEGGAVTGGRKKSIGRSLYRRINPFCVDSRSLFVGLPGEGKHGSYFALYHICH